MSPYLMLVSIFLPVAGGCGIGLFKFKNRRGEAVFTSAVVLLAAALTWALILNRPQGNAELIRFTQNLRVSLRLDGAGSIFAGLVATLWPLSTLYAFEYMQDDARHSTFFAFYTISFGVTLGVAMAGNLLTMYFFYEMLTLSTLPLVMHTMTKRSVHAGRKYLYYSLGGTAFAFIGLVFTIIYGETAAFTAGGFLSPEAVSSRGGVLLVIYFLTFCGFGVKAAIFPLYAWLPDASVAPTPVTALLHAVAVVKSGVFAIIRVTYFCFGAAFLTGTWAQYAAMAIALFTMLFGSVMAVKETHLKRRLAYSTVANLSYILSAVMLLTEAGLEAGLVHMVFHGLMKIGLFFCAGAVICKTGREYIDELYGIGRKMRATFACFTVSALALVGVPPLAGFVSKWKIALAQAAEGGAMGYIGLAVLIVCAFLTAVYMLTVVVKAYFPQKGMVVRDARDPGWKMLVPIVMVTAAVVAFGVWSEPIVSAVGLLAP